MSVNWDDFTPVNPPAQGGVNWDDFTPIEPKKRVAVPDATVGSVAQDIAAGALQIGPTAVKGAANIARLITGDRVGKDTSEALERGMGAIRDMVGSDRSAAQRANFQADMADDDVGIGETIARNKGALADQVLPTIGSMFLPVGVAGAAGKLATAGKAAQGMNAAALAARVASVQKAAGIGTVAAQNAADTFAELLEKGVPMEDAYIGAGITVPFSVVAGVVTGGGAEGAITRALTGATAARAGIKQVGKAMAQEGGQEMGEEAGQIVGEAAGTGAAPSATSAAKRMAVAGTLGAVMGGGVDVASQAGQFRNEPEQPAPAQQPAQPAPAIPPAAQSPAAAAPAAAPVQPTQTAAPAATGTPAADPLARLAELEIISEQRDLTPDERQEAAALLSRLDDEQDASQGTQGTDGALINEGASPQAAPDQTAENAAGNAPASDGVPAAGGNADVQTAGVEAAPVDADSRSVLPQAAGPAPTNFWSFAKSKGLTPGQIQVGSPEHQVLKAEYDALRAGGSEPVLPSLQPPQDVNLQNRDRGRAASVVQMAEIARNPDYMRLGPSRTPDSGAPMVFAVGDDLGVIPTENFGREDMAVMSDGQRVPFRYAVVDATKVNPSNFADGRTNPDFSSGAPGVLKALNNGRTAGIRAAHEMATAGEYVQGVQADAAMHGVSPEVVARTPNPMLVRIYADAENTAGMAAKSQGQGLGMSPAELARQDAPLMDSSVLAVYQPGEVTSAANRDFVRAFIGKLQGAGQDVAGMMTADGQLSQDGRKRIQAALMQAAYGDSDIVEEMFDSTDTDIKAIGEALKTVAGQWANMRDSARLNAINPQVDVTENLLQAIGLIRKARRDNMSLYDLVNQPDLMTGETPAELTVGMLRLFYSGNYLTRAIGKEKLTQYLADYVQGAMSTSAEAGMFGDVVTAGDILATIINRFNEGQANAEAQPQEGRGQPAGSVDTGRSPGEGQPGIGGQAAGEGGPGSNQDRGGQPGQNAQAQAQQQDGQGNQGGQEGNGAQAAAAPGGQRSEPEAQAAGVKAEKPKKASKPKTAKDSKTKAEKPAVTPSDAAQQLERDFRTFPTQILNNLLERGEAAKLYKAASVKGSSAFDGLAMDEKAAAYVKYVEQGGKPVEGLPKDYNAWAASQERDAVVRRLQSDRVVRQENGKPFKSQISAQQFQERYDLTGTHEVVQAAGGFELRQLSIAAQAELKRKAEGRENYTEAQAAVAAEMGIGVNEDGEWDVTDAQFDELERRTAARLKGEKAAPRTEPEPLLTAQTPEEIVARQDAAEAAKREQEAADRKAREQERQAEERKRIAQASERAADTFELGQDPLDSLTGQQPMFSRGKAKEIRNLVTLHNMTAENLAYTDSIGAMPVPSIGITKVDSPFSGFGEITLIGDKSLVDPEQGVPVYDRDAWTARFPTMNFKKPRRAKADAFYERMKAMVQGIGVDSDNFLSNLWESMVNTNVTSPDKVAEHLRRYDAPRMAYARDVLEKRIKIPMRDIPARHPFGHVKSWRDFVAKEADKAKTEEEQSAFNRRAAVAARQAMYEYIDQKSESNPARRESLRAAFDQQFGVYIKDDGMNWNVLDQAIQDARSYGKKEVDSLKLRESVRKVVPDNDPAYLKWASNQVKPIFDAPTITLRGKEVEPTLDNIVQAMTVGATAGVEKSMTFGPGKLAAHLGKRFKSLAEIKAARDQVVSESQESEAKKATDAILDEFRGHVTQFFTFKDYRGNVDTWAANDSSMEALAIAGKGALTDANIRNALSRKDFKRVDDRAIELARQAVEAIRATATNYFEAKPQRAVKLSEFKGAVVPKGISSESLAILEKNGVTVEFYGKADGAREKAIEKLAKRLDKASGGEVMFGRRSASGNRLPDAIIGHKLGDLSRHPDYEAAKAGDADAAARIAIDLVDDALVEKVRQAAGNADVVVPVVSVEAAGRNKIPLAVAEVLADRLGTAAESQILQANSPKRTGMDGLERLLNPPVFDGPVKNGAAYVLVDDTVTQGGTFAAMASHINDSGGRVVAAVALTGKQYSAKLAPSAELLEQVREQFQSVEEHFRAATGYGFDALTESEARYLAKHDDAQSVRDRIVEAGNAAGIEADTGNPGFSQSSQSRTAGLSAAQAQQIADTIASRWAQPPEVVVVQSMQDLRVPEAARNEDARQRAGGATGSPRGFYYRGQVYLIADGLTSVRDVAETLFHEALGHYGLRAVFGNTLDGILDQIAMARPDLMKPKAEEYGKDLKVQKQRREVAEEVLAEMAQTKPELGYVKRAIAAIRTWLRQNVPGFKGLQLTDAEIIRSYILPARAWVERGAQTSQPEIAMAFDRSAPAADQTQTKAFQRWFGDSKAVDASGKPLVVYHGTGADFNVFTRDRAGATSGAANAGMGFFFTDQPEVAGRYAAMSGGAQSVMPVYLSLQNPIRLTAKNMMEADKLLQSQMKPEHDGAIIEVAMRDGGVQTVFMAKESSQVKSSTGNNGDFGPANPDIRFSRSTLGNAPSPQPQNPTPLQRLKAKALQLTSPQAITSLIYEYQDKNVDLKRLRDHIKELGGTITDLNDAYLGEELYHKRVAKRTQDFLSEEMKPLLADLRARGLDLPTLEKYLHARHATEANKVLAERNPNAQMIDAGRNQAQQAVRALELQLQRAKAQGTATKAIEDALTEAREEAGRWTGAQAFQGTEDERLSLSGMSDADADAFINGLAPAQRVHLDALAARVDAINAKTLDTLEKYGLMDRASLDAWRKTYQYYVPLHRDEAHPDAVSHPIGQGFSTKGAASKRRTGSNEKVTNILAHVAMQREAALTRGEKNRVAKKLYLMAAQNPDPEVWTVDKPPMLKTVDSNTGFVRSTVDPTYKNKENVVMVRISGKDQAIVFNERNPSAVRLAQSIKNQDVGDLGRVMRASARFTRFFAAMSTQYNPVFTVVNFVRDLQGGVINLSSTQIADRKRQVFMGIGPALRAIYADVRAERKGGTGPQNQWAQLWDEMQNEGGTTGYRDLFADPAERVKAIEKELAKIDRGDTARLVDWYVTGWVSDMNEAVENAVRLSAYKAARDSGMSKEQSASLAKNITVNFNRKGRLGAHANALYAFFNAAVQGNTRMLQTLSSPMGRKIILGGIALGVLNTMLMVSMLGGDGEDDEYKNLPEFVKSRNLMIPLGGKDYLTVPLPLGLHVLPNIGRLATEFAMGYHQDKGLGGVLGEVMTLVMDAFNPLGGSENVAMVIAPTPLDIPVGIAMNRDWQNRPIARENMSELDPEPAHKLTRDSATIFSKKASELLSAMGGGDEYTPGAKISQWTPDQIDYVVSQLTGGLGREMVKSLQTVNATMTGDELPDYKIPLWGRFKGSTEGPAGQSMQYSENVRKLNIVENSIKGRARDEAEGTLGSNKTAAEYMAGEPLSDLVGVGNAAERQIAKLRQYRASIQRRAEPGYQDEVKQINEQIAEVMTSLNREVNRVKKEAATN